MTVAGGPKPKFQQVAEWIREEIRAGRLEPGDRVPTQEELTKRFGFAGQTVQNGLTELRSEGLIVSAGNLGNFVTEGTSPAPNLHDEITEIRSQLQALTERVRTLEER